QPFKKSGSIGGPPPKKAYDPNFEMETESYEGTVDFSLPLVVEAKAASGTKNVALDVRFQVCNETTCLPPKTVHLSAPVKIVAGAKTAAATSVMPSAPSVAPQSATSSVAPEKPVSSTAVAPAKKAEPSTTLHSQSLGSFIWLAAVMGALSLLTPCVFPMIPITVSYFTNHAS